MKKFIRKDISVNYSEKHDVNHFKKAEIKLPRLSGSKPDGSTSQLFEVFVFCFLKFTQTKNYKSKSPDVRPLSR